MNIEVEQNKKKKATWESAYCGLATRNLLRRKTEANLMP